MRYAKKIERVNKEILHEYIREINMKEKQDRKGERRAFGERSREKKGRITNDERDGN